MPLPIECDNIDPSHRLQVSKAHKLPLLIDPSEMCALFAFLGAFEIFDVSRPVTEDEIVISHEAFLQAYDRYIENLGQNESEYRQYFSAVFSCSRKALYAQPLSSGKYLVKARSPVIQLQKHHFIYSDTFHSGVNSKESISWGIQFSYPRLYLDPKTKAIGKVDKGESFPNTELFEKCVRWVRNATLATPFLIGNQRKVEPMRLGEKCFAWINHHPGLSKRGLRVDSRKNPSLSH